MYHAIIGDRDQKDVLMRTQHDGYDLAPSSISLSGVNIELVPHEKREFKLREALVNIRNDYDFILIDCPPSLGLLTVNALVAASEVLIPIQCEYYALEGISALVSTIQQIRGSINPGLQIEGILRTMYDPRNNLARQVSEELIAHFGDKVFRTIVPRNVRLAEAPSHGLPAFDYDSQSKGAQAYLALAGEVLRGSSRKAA